MFMNKILAFLYGVFLSLVVLFLFWILQPLTVDYPIPSGLILIALLITAAGSTIRVFIEYRLLLPIGLLYEKKRFNLTPIIALFCIGLLIGIIIPWSQGVSGWSWKQWVVSILYTIFSFETFLGFILGLNAVNK